jgi:hypothetical protein
VHRSELHGGAASHVPFGAHSVPGRQCGPLAPQCVPVPPSDAVPLATQCPVAKSHSVPLLHATEVGSPQSAMHRPLAHDSPATHAHAASAGVNASMLASLRGTQRPSTHAPLVQSAFVTQVPDAGGDEQATSANATTQAIRMLRA